MLSRILLLAAVTPYTSALAPPGSGSAQRAPTRRAVLAAPLAFAFSDAARALDSQGRSEGLFGENGLLTPAFGKAWAPPPTAAPSMTPSNSQETAQQKMARVRRERMEAEARAQGEEYRRLQAAVGTQSFGSTVSVGN